MTVTVERVVLATDGSASAATAAAHALFLARVLDASLHAVSATGTPAFPRPRRPKPKPPERPPAPPSNRRKPSARSRAGRSSRAFV
ncbi:universal stress protein [Haloferax volcanii]|uniref:universal stress protein n=1 Tax=Haloferax volcanii TaxID=2246 RepID=UPI00385C0F38